MGISYDAGHARVAPRKIQPGWVRASHWLNALAAVVMMLSGWRIYNASPVFAGFRFPADVTLGGWLGGALQWHFAAMWVLAINGAIYLAMNFATDAIQRVTALGLDIHGMARGRANAHADKLTRDSIIWTHLAGDSVQRMKAVDKLKVEFEA